MYYLQHIQQVHVHCYCIYSIFIVGIFSEVLKCWKTCEAIWEILLQIFNR